MVKPLRLGVFLDHSHLSDGRFTVTQDEALKFIEGLNLAESITQAVSIIPVEKLDPEKYNIVLEQRGVTVIPLPSWRNAAENVLSLFCDFRSHFAKARLFVENCDVIWLRIPSMIGLFFWWVARKKRKPLILHVVSNLLLASKRSKYKGIVKVLAHLFFLIYHLAVKIMTRYGLVLTAGEELKRLYSNPLHPAFSIDDILIKEKDLQSVKKKSGQAKEILFVGRFAYGKGIDILIDAVGNLKSEFPEIRLAMAGDGILLEEMRQRVATQGLNKHVKILGFVSASGPLQELYKKTDIAVLPSDSYPEGFPRVILELWSAGLPLIATRLAGIPYRVKDGVNGLLVTPGNLKELTDAIRKLIVDADLRHRLAEGGSRTVKRFTFEHQVDIIKRLVKRYYPGIYDPV
ncbi:MAG: glycosyltransferase family 1 protein [Candidatus Stahlbacteria bacterium]|nr:MAG: glycosyltransferase family 1 protein [Candidatus Stahlbacteria bacterium]